VIRAAFAQRRKILANALAAAFHPRLTPQLARTTLAQLGIDPNRRGETFSLTEFARLTDALWEQARNPGAEAP
jgi:16S rRNA (adenine1518-N6/adenine1519-N6)-dimethyltransferase